MGAYRKNITLQLGLIAVTADLHSAVESEAPMRTLCLGPQEPHPPATVSQRLQCPECGNTERESFLKGRKEADGYVVATPDEIAEVKSASVGVSKSLVRLTAHPAEEVAAKTLQAPQSGYYLTPSKPALAPLYGLLVDLLDRHPDVALCGLWTPVSRPGFYQVKLFGDTLVMEPRARVEAVKVVQQARTAVPEVNAGQLDQLLASMVSPFDPALYADQYAETLAALLSRRHGVELAPSAFKPAPAMDLSALLEAALAGVAA